MLPIESRGWCKPTVCVATVSPYSRIYEGFLSLVIYPVARVKGVKCAYSLSEFEWYHGLFRLIFVRRFFYFKAYIRRLASFADCRKRHQ